MHTRRLAVVIALVSGIAFAAASPCAAQPSIDHIGGTSVADAQGIFTFPGGGAGSFDPGIVASTLKSGAVSQGTADASFSIFNFTNVTPGSNTYNIGDVTKTVMFANNTTATFSLFNLVATVTPNFVNIMGDEKLGLNGNSANFDLEPFKNAGTFTLTLTNSDVNFQTLLQNGGTTLTGQGSQFTQAAGPGTGPVVPEPASLALWTSLAAAGLLLRRRRS